MGRASVDRVTVYYQTGSTSNARMRIILFAVFPDIVLTRRTRSMTYQVGYVVLKTCTIFLSRIIAYKRT